MSHLIYVLIGYPGSGKGTFSQFLKDEGLNHLSTGDLFRNALKANSSFAIQYQGAIEHGSSLLPTPLVQEMIQERLSLLVKEKAGIILDGFPKNIDQCQFLDRFVEKEALTRRLVAVHVKIEKDVAVKRILSRLSCDPCERLYNSVTHPPQKEGCCDICLGALTKRFSDNEEDVKKRFELFEATMNKVIAFYGDRLRTIDGNLDYEPFREAVLHLHRTLQ